MTRKPRALIAAMLIAGLLAGAVATPAQAAGQIRFHFSPGNAEQQTLLQTGLGIYALVKGIENGSISQKGSGNSAGLAQGGAGNLGIIHQKGNGHNGTISQEGGGNGYGLFQFGQGTNAHVTQYGGQSGLGFVFGW